MDALIEAKKEVFYDLRIPWDDDIVRKFNRAMEINPKSNPEILLDNIAYPYIDRAFLHLKETYVQWLEEQYGDKYVSRKVLKTLLGDEVFEDLLSSGLLIQRENSQSYRVRQSKEVGVVNKS